MAFGFPVQILLRILFPDKIKNFVTITKRLDKESENLPIKNMLKTAYCLHSAFNLLIFRQINNDEP